MRAARGGRKSVNESPLAATCRCSSSTVSVRPASPGTSMLARRVVHLAEAVAAAPDLERVEVEADHLGARDQARIDAAAGRKGRRARVEVVRQRQESDAALLGPGGREPERVARRAEAVRLV